LEPFSSHATISRPTIITRQIGA